jgi:hypothetical protein
MSAHPDTAACFCPVTVERGCGKAQPQRYFISIALRASDVLRLGFATAALR